jgi:hypothetical protein
MTADDPFDSVQEGSRVTVPSEWIQTIISTV